ncbi:MAG: glycosyltransferase family 39 protein [Armatimonadota bacterium]
MTVASGVTASCAARVHTALFSGGAAIQAEGPVGSEEKGVSRSLAADWRVHLGLITLIALIPRIIYLAQIYHWPFFFYPVLDSRTQNAWAEILLKSAGIGNTEVMAKPPLYAYYLALIKALVGTGELSLFVARLLQLVMGAVSCGLTYLIGRRVFGTAVGLLAGAMMACYSPGVFNDGELLDTALSVLLTTFFLLGMLIALDSPTTGRWLGVGLVLGLLGLTRGNLLLLAPLSLVLLFLWMHRNADSDDLRRYAGVFVLGIIMVIAPITVRNYLITGGLVPISNNGGINFYTGNSPNADGYTPILSGVAWQRTWYVKVPGTTAGGLPRTVGSLSLAEQDQFWMRQGIRFWVDHTAGALALLLKKACLYWTAYDIPNNVSYDWGRSHASVLRVLPFTFAIIGPLALTGMVIGGWRNRLTWALTLFVLVQWIAVIAFFVNGRYRMTALPVMCVFGAYAILETLRRARSRERTALALGLLALAASATFVNADLYGLARRRAANRDWLFLGQSYAQTRDFQSARDAFQKATVADPTDADAWFYLANIDAQSGDLVSASAAYRQATKVAPDFADAAARYVELAIAHRQALAEPGRLLAKAVDSQPSNVQALATLVRVDVRLGKNADAAEALNAMADAFSRWSKSDSSYDETQMWVQQAIGDAQAAGIAVPQPPREGAPARVPQGLTQ